MQPMTVIFDIDGVIVDSEQLHFEVLRHLAPEHACYYQPQQLIGLSLEETLGHMRVPREHHADITAKTVATYKSQLSESYLRPGVRALIDALQEAGIPFGFVSTAPRDICLANIALLGLQDPPRLISGDDVLRTKPDPDPYLAMLDILEAEVDRVIVVEDTDLGVLAATRAGIVNVYGWPHELSGQQHYKHAIGTIERLGDIPAFAALCSAI